MKKIKIPTQWKFFSAVLILYFLAWFFNEKFAQEVMIDYVATLKKVLPIIGIVFVVMFILNLFLKPHMIKKHLGQDSGIKGWFYAVIGSIVISGPPYVLMPMIGELRQQGMKTSLVAVFLSNRSVQPIFLPVMAHYFGWVYTILVSFFIILFSIVNGFVIGKITKNQD